MTCVDNYNLPTWAMWTLLALTVIIILLLAISLVENIKRKSAKLVWVISGLLIIADIATLLWIWINSNLYSEGECSAPKYKLILLAIAGLTFLTLNQLSYWLLAYQYYSLSYKLEEIVKPIGFEPMSNCLKKLGNLMIVWIFFWPVAALILYLIN